VAVLYLALLALIYIGMAGIVLPMAQGSPSAALDKSVRRETLLSTLPPAALCLAVLIVGIYIPPTMSAMLHEVSVALGGN
jgi:hydrogenase-4 component F